MRHRASLAEVLAGTGRPGGPDHRPETTIHNATSYSATQSDCVAWDNDEDLIEPVPRRQTTDSVLEYGHHNGGALRRELESTIAAALTNSNRLASSPAGLPGPPPFGGAFKASNSSPDTGWSRGLSSGSTEPGWSRQESSEAASRALEQAVALQRLFNSTGPGPEPGSGAPNAQALSKSALAAQTPVSSPSDMSSRQPSHPNGHAEEGSGPEAASGTVERAASGGGLGGLTTAMVRHLPPKFTQRKFVSTINAAGFSGHYDFVYVPMDSRRHSNRGVGFVNFTTPGAAERFYESFHNRQLSGSGGAQDPPAVLAVLPADMQGFEQNAIHHHSVRKEKNLDAQPLFLRPLPPQAAGATATEEPENQPAQPPLQQPLAPGRRRQQQQQPRQPADRRAGAATATSNGREFPHQQHQQQPPQRPQHRQWPQAASRFDEGGGGPAVPPHAAEPSSLLDRKPPPAGPGWAGQSRQQQQQQERPQSQASKAELATPAVKFCSFCGRPRVDDQYAFCPFCGNNF